ncbi:Clp protease/crotonase-like domain-containing protein [Mycobacterium kiyosense]
MTETLVRETPRSGVEVLRLNRPAQLNAINSALLYVNLTQDHCDGLIRDHLGEEVVAQASS